MSHAMSHANRHALDNDQARSAPLTPTPHISPSSGAGEAVKLTVKLSTISAGRRAIIYRASRGLAPPVMLQRASGCPYVYSAAPSV